ncbi:MAG: hypothetical protein Q4D02_00615 [Clostridia bacterium]|nr:hypothetical protein [Clostridia bacterium]
MKEQDIISNLNMFSEKIFKVLEKEVYDILDNIIDVKPDILTKEPLKYFYVEGELNGIVILANALILLYVLHYVLTQIISIYNGKNVENIYHFLIRIIVIGILVNNSYFICGICLKIFDGISSGVDIFCQSYTNKEITFSMLKENIYQIENIEKSDFLSIEGILKSMVSLGSISILITLSIRYVTVVILLLISPFAIIGLCSNITSGFSKMWLKTLIVNLSMQIFIKLIILIPIVYKDLKSPMYKVILIGSLYLLYKINSFISSIFAKIVGGN